MYGIEETKHLVKVFIDFGNGVGKSLEDGIVTWTDATEFWPMFQDMPQAFMAISKVPSELKDLTEEEKQELIEYVKKEFDIPQDLVESIIEKSLTFAAQAYSFVTAFFRK